MRPLQTQISRVLGLGLIFRHGGARVSDGAHDLARVPQEGFVESNFLDGGIGA